MYKGSAPARAGLRQGDTVVRVDGRRIETIQDLYAALAPHRAGDRVQVVVTRNGERVTAKVPLSSAPRV